MSDIYRQQNFGNRIGFGRSSALLIVDFTVGFNDPKLFGGGNIDAAVQRSVRLLGFFRDRRLPVAFTRVVYADDGSDAGVFCLKAPNLRTLTERAPAGQVVPELKPLDGELVVDATFGAPAGSRFIVFSATKRDVSSVVFIINALVLLDVV